MCFACRLWFVRLCPPEAWQGDFVVDCFKGQYDIHIEHDVLWLTADVGADHPRTLFQFDEQNSIGNVGLECRSRRTMHHTKGVHFATSACRARCEIFAAAFAAHRLLIVLHVSAIAAVLQQEETVAHAAPK